MAYLVLARKYRPQTFEEVVGQEHVTRTLKNAISGNRVAHAILFSGPRGTGKTTIARILAKAVNCESGPTPTPCNACRSCQDITAGRGVDVFEIDGASNNSVDQVRELRDNSRYMPAHSRYKIYIIDEVHMLSIAAFNALLKTLEEPPAHVLFFFATTEAHKIPITILSRCQRHDLRRIEIAAISQHMEALCRQEAVSISSGNLWAIARESGGSMRDALSLLDQVMASRDGQIDDEYVMNLLGGMDRQVLYDLSEATFARDISRTLALIDAVFKNGQDLKRFYADLLLHFRHLMLVKMKARPDMLVDLPPNEIETLARQVKGVSIAFIDQVFTLLFNAEPSVRYASQPRLAIEMAFFKIQQITPALPIDLLIEQLDRLIHDPTQRPVPGIVEAQSAYGDAMTQPTAEPRRTSKTNEPAAAPAPAGNEPLPDPERVQPGDHSPGNDAWRRIIARIAETKPSIAAALSRSQLVSVSEQAFTVKVSDNDYSMNLVKKNLSMIDAVCREHAGRGIHVDFFSGDTELNPATSAKQKADDIRQKLLNHPLLADAVEIFSGKIEEIKIR
ncbi:DNA polymerase III subunit gamma/tau [Desulfosarcina sp.]|uniref:DNA polymerase III subunit gamma/tau n=1 Tax=Desulfosarcina sp. TaxID=2027861 RepID=UPI0029A46BDD|nr:DNA polymerase III subunit gamma/tau [Desulfosarcina sp.]MDX2455738.1 DNA polymerase III subunit gamma/tau [Desulfosarcina sp.]MDX2493210.1 DNA polymerase III subunit gamma/tau [Desulfosarcina sp.]